MVLRFASSESTRTSRQWCQRLASAPKDKFEHVMAEARTGEWELTRHTVKKFLFGELAEGPQELR
jgi:hypothetical protein